LRGDLKAEIESEDQALSTKYHATKILKTASANYVNNTMIQQTILYQHTQN
jgi:hypothetical protein